MFTNNFLYFIRWDVVTDVEIIKKEKVSSVQSGGRRWGDDDTEGKMDLGDAKAYL